MTPRTSVGRPAGTAGWPVPAALVALSAIPLTAGTLRLIQLAGGPAVLPADERFAGFPTALVVLAGSAMVACLILGFVGVRHHDIPAHRAWMIRAYAIGLAAGTQAFTEGFGGALFGTGGVRGDLFKAAGWVINLAVAEWVIRRPRVSARARLVGVPS